MDPALIVTKPLNIQYRVGYVPLLFTYPVGYNRVYDCTISNNLLCKPDLCSVIIITFHAQQWVPFPSFF